MGFFPTDFTPGFPSSSFATELTFGRRAGESFGFDLGVGPLALLSLFPFDTGFLLFDTGVEMDARGRVIFAEVEGDVLEIGV